MGRGLFPAAGSAADLFVARAEALEQEGFLGREFGVFDGFLEVVGGGLAILQLQREFSEHCVKQIIAFQFFAVGDGGDVGIRRGVFESLNRIEKAASTILPSGGNVRRPAVTDRSSKNCVPQVIFTIPEVAAVGLTAEQAASAGMRIRVIEYEIGNVAGARLFADDYQGRAQMVVDEDRRVIVGLTLAGPGVGEMIHAATIAVVGEVPLDRLWHAVPSYPTMSELWLRLLETYGL